MLSGLIMKPRDNYNPSKINYREEKVFAQLELCAEVHDLRKLGLTTLDINGYLSFFYNFECRDIN